LSTVEFVPTKAQNPLNVITHYMAVNNCAAEYEMAKQIKGFLFVVKTETSVTVEGSMFINMQ
jgi:hypothetical protein